MTVSDQSPGRDTDTYQIPASTAPPELPQPALTPSPAHTDQRELPGVASQEPIPGAGEVTGEPAPLPGLAGKGELGLQAARMRVPSMADMTKIRTALDRREHTDERDAWATKV